MVEGVRSLEVRSCRRFAKVGGARLSEVRKRWRCAVVGGARCGWGSVRGGVSLVVVVGRWTVLLVVVG